MECHVGTPTSVAKERVDDRLSDARTIADVYVEDIFLKAVHLCEKNLYILS